MFAASGDTGGEAGPAAAASRAGGEERDETPATAAPQAKTDQTASPLCSDGQLRGGAQASIRRGRPTQLDNSVRRVLRHGRLSH